jgi:hypothetical protein
MRKVETEPRGSGESKIPLKEGCSPTVLGSPTHRNAHFFSNQAVGTDTSSLASRPCMLSRARTCHSSDLPGPLISLILVDD